MHLIVINSPDAPLLLPSLRLFIPPLRLVSAAMWQVVQRGDVQDFGMVEEFISTVTEILPDLLNADQKAQLLLGLRARVRKKKCSHSLVHIRLGSSSIHLQVKLFVAGGS